MSFLSKLFGPSEPDITQLKNTFDVHGLINALDYKKNNFIRYNAVLALAEIRNPAAIKPLIVTLHDSDEQVRKQAIIALRIFRDPGTVEPLIERLTDNSQEVRFNAIMALGELRDPQAVEPLIREFVTKRDLTRYHAATALAEIGDPRAVEPLIAALNAAISEKNNPDWKSLQRIAWALGEFGDLRGIDPLRALLQDCNDSLAKETITNALKALGNSTDRTNIPRTLCLQDFRAAYQHFESRFNDLKPADAKIIEEIFDKWGSPSGFNRRWEANIQYRKGCSKNEILSYTKKLIHDEVTRRDFSFDAINIYDMSDDFWKDVRNSVTQLNVLFDIGRPGYSGCSYFILGRTGDDTYDLLYSLYI